MLNFKILGTGCAKCKQTETLVKQVIKEMNVEATVEKIEDIQKIMEYNVLSTPVLVVNEVIKIKGRVPTVQEIKSFL